MSFAMEQLESALGRISLDCKEILLSSFQLWPGKRILVRRGTIAEHIFFINRGFALIKFKTQKGDMVRHISRSSEFITAIDSFENETPSQEQIIAVGDYEVYAIHKMQLMALRKTFPALEHLWTKSITNYLIACQRRITDLLSLDSETYYQKLLAEKREIFQTIPQYELASYLGIRAQSLSRIRKSIT